MQHPRASVAVTSDQVVDLRPAWEAMDFRHRNADLDVILTMVQGRKEVDRPHVLVAEVNDRPVAMLIGLLEQHDVSARFGYFTVFRVRRRCLRIVHGGIAGPGAEEAAPVLLSSVLESLRRREVDLVLFSYLDVARVRRHRAGGSVETATGPHRGAPLDLRPVA